MYPSGTIDVILIDRAGIGGIYYLGNLPTYLTYRHGTFIEKWKIFFFFFTNLVTTLRLINGNVRMAYIEIPFFSKREPIRDATYEHDGATIDLGHF